MNEKREGFRRNKEKETRRKRRKRDAEKDRDPPPKKGALYTLKDSTGLNPHPQTLQKTLHDYLSKPTILTTSELHTHVIKCLTIINSHRKSAAPGLPAWSPTAVLPRLEPQRENG